MLLLDLDNTLADRERAFAAWAQTKVEAWAPDERDAVAYLIEQDDDGIRPRHEFFSAVRERFGLQHPVEELVAGYRRELRDTLPAVPDDVVERLRALRAGGWKLAVVTNGAREVQAQKMEHLGVLALLDGCCISGELGIRKPDPRTWPERGWPSAASRVGGERLKPRAASASAIPRPGGPVGRLTYGR